MWQHNSEWVQKHTLCLQYLVQDHIMLQKFNIIEQKQNQMRSTKQYEPFQRPYIFNNHTVAVEKFDQLRKIGRLPPEILAVAYHRRFFYKDTGLFCEFSP